MLHAFYSARLMRGYRASDLSIVYPVTRVAPLREMSMMVDAWLGARVLDEGALRQRMWAAGLIVLGVAALALG